MRNHYIKFEKVTYVDLKVYISIKLYRLKLIISDRIHVIFDK
jgi:hypothetical protein